MGKVHFLRIYLFDPSYFLTNPSEKSCKSFLFFKNATKFTTCREYFEKMIFPLIFMQGMQLYKKVSSPKISLLLPYAFQF